MVAPKAGSHVSFPENAILILPGGNYDYCSLRGPMEFATWVSALGLRAYVLQYRVRSGGYFWPAPLEDYVDAMEMIIGDFADEAARRETTWHTRPKIGVLGSSAGGHLASYVASTVPSSLKPDFQILLYPACDVETPADDPWLARLGYPGPATNTFDLVTPATPPCFTAVSTFDEVSSFELNVEPLLAAYKANNVPYELVLEPIGKGQSAKSEHRSRTTPRRPLS